MGSSISSLSVFGFPDPESYLAPYLQRHLDHRRRQQAYRRINLRFVPDSVADMVTVLEITCAISDGAYVVDNAPNNPTNIAPIPDANGAVNFFRKLETNHASSGGRADLWKEKLGAGLKTRFDPQNKTFYPWILRDLPGGFALWENVHYTAVPLLDVGGAVIPGQFLLDATGKPIAAADSVRSDCYLFGFPGAGKKRYRSPREFTPHLVWLSSDRTVNRGNCECQHCTAAMRRARPRVEAPSVDIPTDPILRPDFPISNYHPGYYVNMDETTLQYYQ